MNIQRILVPLFTFVWWERLHDHWPYSEFNKNKRERAKVKRVLGWRTALLEEPSGVKMVTFLLGRR